MFLIKQLNESVNDWNNQINEQCNEEERKILHIDPIKGKLFPSALFTTILAPKLSPEQRKEICECTVNHLYFIYGTTKAHIYQLHNICTTFLHRSITLPTIESFDKYSDSLNEILSLEHALDAFNDPIEKLRFLQSINPEQIPRLPDDSLNYNECKKIGVLTWQLINEIEGEDAHQ